VLEWGLWLHWGLNNGDDSYDIKDGFKGFLLRNDGMMVEYEVDVSLWFRFRLIGMR
jgi:hypothetical protein